MAVVTVKLGCEHCIWSGGIVRHGCSTWEVDLDALPEWDALHGALRKGMAQIVDGPGKPEPKPKRGRKARAATPEPEPEIAEIENTEPVADASTEVDALADTITDE